MPVSPSLMFGREELPHVDHFNFLCSCLTNIVVVVVEVGRYTSESQVASNELKNLRYPPNILLKMEGCICCVAGPETLLRLRDTKSAR